jgi:methylenetetrahydrofolate dehydrogenase (NADP+)/methenyltetrahydrofolate cyclohydrolase
VVERLKVKPRIGSVAFEEDEGSLTYTRLKKEAAVRVGMEFDEKRLSIHNSINTVIQSVKEMGEREDIHGLLVQKPMRQVWQKAIGNKWKGTFTSWWRLVTSGLSINKDVDCLTQENLNLVYEGKWRILPAAVKAVMLILGEALETNPGVDYRIGVEGKVAVVVGTSELVGRPLAAVLKQMGAEVTNCGIKTLDLKPYTLKADILVSATGKPGLITREMVKLGAVVIDVGEPKGDVEFSSVKAKASFITPVPGGVGPVTVVSLLENLMELIC